MTLLNSCGKKINSTNIKERGPALQLESISKDNRYLISEMACKSFGDDSQSPGEMRSALKEAYDDFRKESGNQITFRQLIEGNLPREYKENQMFQISGLYLIIT